MKSAKLDLNFVKTLLQLEESEFLITLTESLPLLLSDLQTDDTDEFHSIRIAVLERYFSGETCAQGTVAVSRRYATINEVISTLVARFVESMSAMEDELRNGTLKVSDPVDRTLAQNMRILNCVKTAITYLSGIREAVDIECVPDTPKSVLTIMLKTFEHCKDMENIYADQLNRVKAHMTTALGECHELQRVFFCFLSKLNVNCQFEREFQLLTDALEMTFRVGAVVISLDLKTMAEQWKGYTNLLRSYSSSLKRHFDISKTINFLVRQITDQVMLMCGGGGGGGGGGDHKFLNLTSKISCFLLKIVSKLCEYFSDCLHGCVAQLLEFILFVNGYSYSASSFASGRNLAVVEKVESCLLPGVEPLVKLLVAERQFARHYANVDIREIRKSGRSMEYLSLLRCILRQVLSRPDETYRLWMETECDLLDCVLRAVCEFEEQLCYQVKFDLCSSSGSGSGSGSGSSSSSSSSNANLTRGEVVSSYDDLLINVSALIITRLDENRFYHVEEVLLSNVFFNESHLAALFTCDLWCVLVRYGSADLCFQHVRYLISVFSQVEHAIGARKRTLLVSLVQRIFGFLTGSQQWEILSSRSKRFDDELYVECCAVSAASVKTNVGRQLVPERVAKCEQSSSSSKETSSSSSSSSSRQLLATLRVASTVTDFDAFSVSFPWWEQVVFQHWNRYPQLSTHQDFRRHVDTLASLCDLTRAFLSRTSDSRFFRVLQCISYLCKCDSIFVKLSCVNMLKDCGHHEIQTTQLNEISDALAVLFGSLLRDENPIVKQHCLEAFTYFAHFTRLEKVISLTTSTDNRIADGLSAYIHRQPQKQVLSKPWHRYLRSLRSEAKRKKNSGNAAKMHQPPQADDSFSSKRMKLDNNILDYLNGLESNLTVVSDYLNGQHLLTEEEKCILNRSLTLANELRKFI